MKRLIGVAAIAVFGLAAPAHAAKKPAAGLQAIQLECFKQQGAFLDPETKRWVIKGGDLDMVGRLDAINNCVTQRTGKRQAPFLREERTYH